MKVYGNVTLSEGSDIRNLTAPCGAGFPNEPTLGELFYLNGLGLCFYDGSSWQAIAKESTSIVNDSFTVDLDNGLVSQIIPSQSFKTGSTQLYVAGIRLKLFDDYVEHGTYLTLNFDLSQEDINAGSNIVLDYKTA